MEKEDKVDVNKESRSLYLVGEINQESANTCLMALHYFDSLSADPIDMIMFSGGGVTESGWAIYDAIRIVKSPVTITAYGKCCSTASCILQAATTRQITPSCRFMIHNGSVSLDSTVDQLKTLSKEVQIDSKKAIKVLSERSTLTFKEVQKLCNQETFLSAHDTVKYGFADTVVNYTKNWRKK